MYRNNSENDADNKSVEAITNAWLLKPRKYFKQTAKPGEVGVGRSGEGGLVVNYPLQSTNLSNLPAPTNKSSTFTEVKPPFLTKHTYKTKHFMCNNF